jgi:hypothetical protein
MTSVQYEIRRKRDRQFDKIDAGRALELVVDYYGTDQLAFLTRQMLAGHELELRFGAMLRAYEPCSICGERPNHWKHNPIFRVRPGEGKGGHEFRSGIPQGIPNEKAAPETDAAEVS